MTEEMTVEEAREWVREHEEEIKLHTIWLLLGAPPIPDAWKEANNGWK